MRFTSSSVSNNIILLRRSNYFCDRKPSQEIASSILAAVNEIEDTLYYFSDVISAGILDVGRLMTDNLLVLLIFPILFPSLSAQVVNVCITPLDFFLCFLMIMFIH